jgi:hypothetical protein
MSAATILRQDDVQAPASVRASPQPELQRSSKEIPHNIIVAAAIVVGSLVRFFRLGNRELGIDESVSWNTASANNLTELFRIQRQADSGKLPVHELVLRLWIRFFGDSEFEMRALSAIIGVVCIALVFVLAREMLVFRPSQIERENDRNNVGQSAAICALLFALSLPVVDISREARMYSLMLAMILAQVALMFRAGRLGGLKNYVGLSLFTALAIATNFTAALLVVFEAAWLGWIYWARSDKSARQKVSKLSASIFCGGLLLLPFLGGFKNSLLGVQRGDFTWIHPLGRFELLTTFESGLGIGPFLLILLLAILGGIRLWQKSRETLVAAILWISMPATILYFGSQLFVPMLVTRYVVSSFIPLLFLAAVGITSVRSRSMRSFALITMLALSLIRVSGDFRPGKSRWREACQVAVSKLGSDRRIGACHDYSLVRYYLPRPAGKLEIVRIEAGSLHDPLPPVAIVSPTVPPADLAKVRRAYPGLAKNLTNIWVLTRDK